MYPKVEISNTRAARDTLTKQLRYSLRVGWRVAVRETKLFILDTIEKTDLNHCYNSVYWKENKLGCCKEKSLSGRPCS